MIEAFARQLGVRRRNSPFACFVALSVSLFACFLLGSVPAFWLHGLTGIAAAAVAAGVCGAAGLTSLAIVVVTRSTPQKVAGLFASMLIRTGVPLAFGIAISRSGGVLAEAGVFGMIVCFYLLMLFIETWLSVSLVDRGPSGESRAV